MSIVDCSVILESSLTSDQILHTRVKIVQGDSSNLNMVHLHAMSVHLAFSAPMLDPLHALNAHLAFSLLPQAHVNVLLVVLDDSPLILAQVLVTIVLQGSTHWKEI
jgi:hypothetical protein